MSKNQDPLTSVREYVLQLRWASGGVKPFFKKLYGREPVGNEHITFNNLLRRGHYPAEFVGLLVEKCGIGHVTLAEFYGIDSKKELPAVTADSWPTEK